VALRALASAGHEVAVAVTRPDKRRGRGAQSSPTPVKLAAAELAIPVSHDVASVTTARAELGVVVAYGRLIKADVLAAVPMVNLHFSLLPRWRGAAPVERAILAGDAVTGVCLMAVEEELDTGAVYRRAEAPIGPDETADELTARLARIGSGLLVAALEEGLGEPVPQEGEPTYASVTAKAIRRAPNSALLLRINDRCGRLRSGLPGESDILEAPFGSGPCGCAPVLRGFAVSPRLHPHDGQENFCRYPPARLSKPPDGDRRGVTALQPWTSHP
jgi:hypothetical protein